jgi:hypothetical protein
VSGVWCTADNRSGIEWQWALTTASGHQATEGHTQGAAVGIKEHAAGIVWQVLNNGRRVAGCGTVQAMSGERRAASDKQRVAGSMGWQGTDNRQTIYCLGMGWCCCCVVAVGVYADVLDERKGIAGEMEINLAHKEIGICRRYCSDKKMCT